MKRMILLFSRDIYCIYATTKFNLTKHISEETPNRWKIHKKKQFPRSRSRLKLDLNLQEKPSLRGFMFCESCLPLPSNVAPFKVGINIATI
jgi:hypothetical protein